MNESVKGTTHGRRRTQGIQRIDLAYAEVASSEVARDMNRDVVLELIRTKQPVSRADLSRLSGLRQVRLLDCGAIANENWITEGPAERRPRGRRPTLLSINAEMVILVADVRPTQTILAVIDLNGRFLSRESFPLINDAERGVEHVIAGMQQMLLQHLDKSFQGIEISLPGRVDPVTQRFILAPNLPWALYDLKKAVERAIPLRVEMDNAANACMLAELWFGRMDGVRNAVLATISEGVGSAILANGQLVIAGEFGHVSLHPDDPRCGCGRSGCWEVYASSNAAIGYYVESNPKASRPSIMELLKLAEEDDPGAVAALSRQATYLGRGLRMIATVMAPEVILLTGGLTSSWKRFGPIVEAELTGKMLAGEAPKVVVIGDAELARLRGAAALVLQRHSGSDSTAARKLTPGRTAAWMPGPTLLGQD